MKIKKFIFPLLLLSLIVMVRGGTRDTAVYKYVFEQINDYSLKPINFIRETYMEPGYGWLSFVINNLGFNYQLVFFLISIATFYAIKKAADNFRVSFYPVLICYLSTFFWIHQFMQIRQGLAVAIAFYVISQSNNRMGYLHKFLMSLVSISFHIVAVAPVFFSFNWIKEIALGLKLNFYLKIIVIVTFTIFVARILMSSSFLDVIGFVKHESYFSSQEVREIFHPVNLRSLVLLMFFSFFSYQYKNNSVIVYLVMIYAVSFGLRLGFYDFLVLSGRLATSLGFVEIFLVPMVAKVAFNKVSAHMIVGVYFVANLFISLYIQVPYVLEDYFKPIQVLD